MLAIVGVSLAVVLGVVCFFLHRQGLLDWTGIGMRSVPLEVAAEGWNEESTPLVLHVTGTRSSGVAYERDLLVKVGQDALRLPQGSFEVAIAASPINEDGTLYSVSGDTRGVEVEGREVTVSGADAAASVAASTGKDAGSIADAAPVAVGATALSYTLAHLDIIDATDEQVLDAKTAAGRAAELDRGLAAVVEANVAALDKLRATSVLPDDMPAELVLESTMSGWSTRVVLLVDGTFTGVYTQPLAGMTATDYPNGTAYTCTFSGTFTDVQRLGTDGFRMTLGEVTTEHEVGEKWVADGVLNIGAQPLGFETGTTFELFRPGTSTAEMGYWLSAWCNDYATNGVPSALDRWALDNVDASYGFFSAAEGADAAAAADGADAAAADSDTAADTTTDATESD